MIGRGAQGHPWIFREILHYLQTGQILAAPNIDEVSSVLLEHVANVHQFYGGIKGCRIARKHVGWYLAEHDQQKLFRAKFNAIEDAGQQIDALTMYFDKLAGESALNFVSEQVSPAA